MGAARRDEEQSPAVRGQLEGLGAADQRKIMSSNLKGLLEGARD